MKTFVDAYLNNEVKVEQIDDFIDNWHKNRDIKIPLAEYLGFTEQEYAWWVREDDILLYILAYKEIQHKKENEKCNK